MFDLLYFNGLLYDNIESYGWIYWFALYKKTINGYPTIFFYWFGLGCLTPLSTIFQLYLGRSVLLVGETGVPGENYRPVACHWQTLLHNVVWLHLAMNGVRTHNFSGDRHCFSTGSCKFNYHTITITTAPLSLLWYGSPCNVYPNLLSLVESVSDYC